MKRTAAVSLVFFTLAAPAAADELSFFTILGESQAMFKLGTGSTGAAALMACERLVNDKPDNIRRSLNTIFNDSSVSFAQSMPKAIEDAIQACKAKGFKPGAGAPS